MTIDPNITREHALADAVECLRVAHLIAAGDERLLPDAQRLLAHAGTSDGPVAPAGPRPPRPAPAHPAEPVATAEPENPAEVDVTVDPDEAEPEIHEPSRSVTTATRRTVRRARRTGSLL
jgi:hypothetical protein